jgi:hypothetical protein
MFIANNHTIAATKAKKANKKKKAGDKGKPNGETVNANGTKNPVEMDDDVGEDDELETSTVREKSKCSRVLLTSP